MGNPATSQVAEKINSWLMKKNILERFSSTPSQIGFDEPDLLIKKHHCQVIETIITRQ